MPSLLKLSLPLQKTEVSAEDDKCYVFGLQWPPNFTCPAHVLSSFPPLPSLRGRNQKEWGCSSESRRGEKKRRKKEEDWSGRDTNGKRDRSTLYTKVNQNTQNRVLRK
ncbi:hypothetical protein AAY473_039919 [Plecturocebus cupreus]